MPQLIQASDFGKQLGCQYNPRGIVVDSYGRTKIQGLYAAGDASVIAPAKLIIAAAEGVRAAVGVNMDLTQKEFFRQPLAVVAQEICSRFRGLLEVLSLWLRCL